ncbi:enoyl-CoA hydratase-related protein [Paraconexibacter sp. AEG42_29]
MSTPATAEAVTLEVEDGIARLTLNRPDVMNALDGEMGAALRRHAESLVGRDDVRVVLIASTGRMFCAGGKLDYVLGADDSGAAMQTLATDFHAAQQALASIDAPVVTVVQGTAAGGGFGLAISGDIVLAATSAKLTLAYTKAGLTPDGGATWLLTRIVGLRKATELTLLNTVLSAQDAADIGLVTRVVADDELAAAAEEVATQLAAGPLEAHGRARRLLQTALQHTLQEQLDAEAASIGAQAGGPEGQEGMKAFLDRRAPNFAGA